MGQAGHQLPDGQIAASSGQLESQEFRQLEMLKDGDNIGECFMERQDVTIGRFLISMV
jgi:hypothetical protein